MNDSEIVETEIVRGCLHVTSSLSKRPDESWRECHLHARNLLGPTGYQALLDELADGDRSLVAGSW